MAEHTIYTRALDGDWLRVECACGEAIGTFTDTLIGRALATSAKTAHRLAAEPDRGVPVLPDYETSPETLSVLERVAAERQRQMEKWGHQRHPDDTGGEGLRLAANLARTICQGAAAHTPGGPGWRLILNEEVAEAFAETDPEKLLGELVQVMAVCSAWIEDIESRTT